MSGDDKATVPQTCDIAAAGAPFQLLPDLSPDEYAALRDDIAANGVRVPVDVDQHGRILDGHHRARVCRELGIEPPVRVVRIADDAAARDHALTVNTTRRHLTREQLRATVARSLLADPGLSDRSHARRCGTSPTTVGGVRDLMEATGQLSKLDSRRGADGKARAYRKTWQQPSPELLAAAMAKFGIRSVLPILAKVPMGLGVDDPEKAASLDSQERQQQQSRRWDRFCDGVRDTGIRWPIIITADRVLVDGRNRLMAAALTGADIELKALPADRCDPNNWCQSFNFGPDDVHLTDRHPESHPELEPAVRKLADWWNYSRRFLYAIGLDIRDEQGPAQAHAQVRHLARAMAEWVVSEIPDDQMRAIMAGWVSDALGDVAGMFEAAVTTAAVGGPR